MRRCALVLLASLWCLGAPSAADPNLEGRWVGEVEATDAVLHVEIEVERKDEDALEGQIVILEHGAEAKTLTDVRQQGLRVSFRILNMAGFPVFQGWIEAGGDVLSGTLTQAGVAMPFRLERAEPPIERARALLVGVESMVEKAMDDYQVPGLALGVVLDGEVVFQQGFGEVDRSSGIPVALDTRFALGTATETLTVAMLAAAVDDGRLAWDDQVSQHLPELLAGDPAAWSDITVRDVVAHRTGIPAHVAAWYGDDATPEEFLARFARLPRSRPVRSTFAHQVLGSLAAARVVERLFGAPWESVIFDELTQPLGMSDTGLGGIDPSCARGHRERNGVLEPVVGLPTPGAVPAMGAVMTIGDLLIWVRAHLERLGADGLLVATEQTLHELMSPQTAVAGFPRDPDLLLEAYGLGWFVEAYRGRLHVYRSGDADGFTCQLSILPADDLAVVVAANAEGTGLPELLARQLIDRLLEHDYRDWLGQGVKRSGVVRDAVAEAQRRQAEGLGEGGPPLRELAAYAGMYGHPGYGVFSVTDLEDRLQMTRGAWRVGLVHWRDHLFRVADDSTDILPDGTPVIFRTGAHGEVGAMVVPFEPEIGPLVLERKPEARLKKPEYLDRLTGLYRAVGQEIRVTRRGTELMLAIGGGPTRRMLPRPGEVFGLEHRPATQIRFVLGGDGPATDVRFDQPGGEFVAPRIVDLGRNP